jgi:phytanoyl-CoA hydroxylase
MINQFKDKFRREYHLIKHYLKKKENVDFEPSTLPLIDRDIEINDVIKNLTQPKDLPYDIVEKLQFWREKGYVVLENVLPPDWLDKLWGDVEYTIENHEKFSATALLHGYNGQLPTPLKDVPKEKLKDIGSRLNDFHHLSVGAKKVMAHPNIAYFLQAVLAPDLTAFQSLIFKYSSQQGTHQDFPWVTSNIPSHLAAAWIPLEDVHADSGPLFYYPGSHRLPKFDFGNTGILFQKGRSLFKPEDFEEYLEATNKKNNINKEILLIKKGDILIWHGALAHGGSPIKDPQRTRKSFVCHYSTTGAYPKHRYESSVKSVESHLNGVTFYADPNNLAEEDILKAGNDWS